MKAPDKCYITREKNGVIYSLSFNDNGGLEYIRKDAILEWANGELMPGNSKEGKGWNLAIQTLIDKLNSL